MTREEAIEVLNNTSFFAPSMSDVDEALDMAIEALEQEPCEDTISRQDAIDALQGRKRGIKTWGLIITQCW